MWKKRIGLVAALALLTGGVMGCKSAAADDTIAAASAQAESDSSSVSEGTSGGSTSAGSTSEETKLLVAAAASLKNAYDEKLIPMFEEENPGITVSGTYDSSGKLQTQIEEGLEADLFMSAASKQMTDLDTGGFVDSDTITNLLENKIVLIVPKGEEGNYSAFEDIVKAQTIAIGDPASVPAGQYGKQALENLGLYTEVKSRLSLGTNVTEVLNQVAQSSADAGIVYKTDAASMPDEVLVIAEAPADSVDQVVYPVAVLKDSANKEAAQKFLDFLKSDEALDVFTTYGFTPL